MYEPGVKNFRPEGVDSLLGRKCFLLSLKIKKYLTFLWFGIESWNCQANSHHPAECSCESQLWFDSCEPLKIVFCLSSTVNTLEYIRLCCPYVAKSASIKYVHLVLREGGSCSNCKCMLFILSQDHVKAVDLVIDLIIQLLNFLSK